MNFVNRIVVILLIVAIIFAAIGAAAYPDQIVLGMQALFDPMRIEFLDRVILAVVAIVATVGGAMLIRLELRREKPRGVVLANVEGASAQLQTESIAERLKQVLEALPDIHSASPKVKSLGKSVDILVILQADSGVDVTQKAAEAAAVIRDTVEKGMGVVLAKGSPKVDIKYHTSSSSRLPLTH